MSKYRHGEIGPFFRTGNNLYLTQWNSDLEAWVPSFASEDEYEAYKEDFKLQFNIEYLQPYIQDC